ncbi:hypothetical protein Tco_0946216 [Tanacetum coccineum]
MVNLDLDVNVDEVASPQDMITGKRATLNGNCQKFNFIYKRVKHNGKSEGNEVDLLERAKLQYCEESKGGTKKITQEHAWRVLKFRPKWDSAEPVDLTELFVDDVRPRSPGKPRPTKKPNRK